MTGNSIVVAWSRANEDEDGQTRAPVHLVGDEDRTLCGIPITAAWEITIWDAANLDSWVGCMRCQKSIRRVQA